MEFAGRLKKVRIKLIMIGICLIFLGGYSLIQEWKDQEKNTTKKVFDQYTDAFFKENISTNEITMHFLLENPEKYRLEQAKNLYPSMDQGSVLNEKIKISKEIEKLKKFKQKELTKKQKNTYMVLMDYLRRQKNLSMYPYYERILGKTSGQQAQILLTLSEYRLKNEKDIKSYFQLLNGLDGYFDSLIEYSKEQVKRNLFLSDQSLKEVLQQIQNVIKQKENNMLVATFNLRIADIKGINAAQKKKYCRENKKLIGTKVLPAYEKLYSHLQALNGNGKNENGLYYYKNGKEYYKVLVAQKTGSDKTIEEMIEISDRSIEKCLRKLIKLQKKYPNSINEYRNHKKNIKIVQNPQNILNKLRQKMVKYYPKAPKVSCKIKYVHKTMEEYTSPAFYMVPAIDSYKENVIYVNQAQTAELYPTLAHEGYPGHMYHWNYMIENEEPELLMCLDNTGYMEGWTMYIEANCLKYFDFGKEQDIADELSQIYTIDMRLSYVVSALADILVNYYSYDKEQLSKTFSNYGFDAAVSESVYETVVSIPGLYPCYYLGCYELLQMRKQAETELGAEFDEKEFNELLLETGICYYSQLEEVVDNYIEGRK